MSFNVNDFAFSALHIGISDSDTELILQPGDGLLFPSPNFQCVIYSKVWGSAHEDTNREIITVTDVSDDTLTIVRGRGGTTQKPWSAGDKIYNPLTAEALDDINAGKIGGLPGVSGNANKIIGVNGGADGWEYKTIINALKIQAISSAGLAVYEDGGEGIFIKDGGNVGIGTVNPTSRLHLEKSSAGVFGVLIKHTGVASSDAVRLLFTTPDATVSLGKEGSDGGILVSGSLGHAGVLTSQGLNALQFGTNDAVRITIDPTGKIGIGTNAPGQILDLNAGSGNMVADGYDTHSLSKYKENIIDKDTTGFINKIKSFRLKEYTKLPFVSTEELVKLAQVEYNLENIKDARLYLDSLDADNPIKIWIDNKRVALQDERRSLPIYQKKHLGLVVDDPDTMNALGDVINRDNSNNPKSYSLNNYVGFLHGVISELIKRVEILEAK